MFVSLIIAGLMVVVFRIYKTNADYETAHQVDDFVKAVDKGLFMMNAILQSASFRKPEASNIEGDNGGLYLMVSDASFDSVYRALMNGDCMVRFFNSNWKCEDGKLCLVGILEKKYLNTYMIPKVLQGRVFFVAYPVKDFYEVVVDSKTGERMVVGQLVKLGWMIIDLSVAPQVAQILQNLDSRYTTGTRLKLLSLGFGSGPRGTILAYPLNNFAGHLVIVRSGYVCR
uniref:Uncharacterized protein n=1 Tax=Thermocrinis ruber TaxID=75906 RepID=A0A7C5WZ88_9AQUI